MGYLSGAYNYVTNAFLGGSANIQSKVGAATSYYWYISDGSTKKIVRSGKSVVIDAGADTGLTTTRADKTIAINAAAWATQEGSLVKSTAADAVDELVIGDADKVLTSNGTTMSWAASADTNDYVSSASFVGGTLTGLGTGPAGFSVSLDGRYLTSQFGQAGDTNYVSYFSDPSNITGTSGLQYDGTDLTIGGGLTSDGGILHKTSTYTTLGVPTPLNIGSDAYHVHIINIIDAPGTGGVTQTIELPDAIAGQEIIITTDCGVAAAGGPAAKMITLAPLGSDNINTLLTTTTLNNNGDENFSIYKFMVLADGVTWAGAKMGKVL